MDRSRRGGEQTLKWSSVVMLNHSIVYCRETIYIDIYRSKCFAKV